MEKLKEYKKPTAREMEISPLGMMAASGLQYTNESADKGYEVLAGKNRGEWGSLWN